MAIFGRVSVTNSDERFFLYDAANVYWSKKSIIHVVRWCEAWTVFMITA